MAFYRCNPFKNRICGKRDCYINGGKCFLTMDIDSSTDEKALDETKDARTPNKEQERIKERWFKKEKEKEEE